jgi:uncharacterized protein YegL
MPAKERSTTQRKRAPRKKKAIENSILNVAFVLDMSGSMGSIWDATIEGANSYIRDLQQDEEAETTRFTLVIFDDQYEQWHLDVPVADAEFLTRETYIPRGSTALHDAIAKTVSDLDARLKSGGRQDEKNLIVVMTDGFENASREYGGEEGRKRLSEMVEAYEKKGNWTFVYLGANDYDVKKTAVNLGMSPGNTTSYSTTHGSTEAVMAMASLGTSTLKRSLHSSTPTFNADAGLPDDVRDEDDPTKK